MKTWHNPLWWSFLWAGTAPGWQAVARLHVSRGFARTSYSGQIVWLAYGFMFFLGNVYPEPWGKFIQLDLLHILHPWVAKIKTPGSTGRSPKLGDTRSFNGESPTKDVGRGNKIWFLYIHLWRMEQSIYIYIFFKAFWQKGVVTSWFSYSQWLGIRQLRQICFKGRNPPKLIELVDSGWKRTCRFWDCRWCCEMIVRFEFDIVNRGHHE